MHWFQIPGKLVLTSGCCRLSESVKLVLLAYRYDSLVGGATRSLRMWKEKQKLSYPSPLSTIGHFIEIFQPFSHVILPAAPPLV